MLHLKQTLHNTYTTVLFKYLNDNDDITVTWSCSPKLSSSGESWEDAIKPNVAASYQLVDFSDLYLKFVVADRTDIEEAGRAVQAYRDAGVECPVYLMPMGGRSEEYSLNVKDVAEACMERGWRFTPRLHISLIRKCLGNLEITRTQQHKKAMTATIDKEAYNDCNTVLNNRKYNMMTSNYIFTSESVSAGHPDKVADQISDALVDAGFAAGDETTRVAIETLVTTNSCNSRR